MAFLLKTTSNFVIGKQLLNVYFFQGQQLQLQNFKATTLFFNRSKKDLVTAQKECSNAKRKQPESIKITLMQNQNVTITALEDAKNLAKRRSMNLVKVQDSDCKTQRPVYKLLTPAEMLQNELTEVKATGVDQPARVSKKSEKSLSITSRIADHDLASRLKNIIKWLNKHHEVRILIQATSEKDLPNCEKIFKTIEEAIKTPQIVGRIIQKRAKANMIKFSILPAAETADGKTSTK